MRTALTDAIGVMKLAMIHLDHPAVVSAHTLRGACAEAIERLSSPQQAGAADLGELYSRLVSVTPRGFAPCVTLTNLPATPYGCVITNAAGEVVDRQIGKTIEGLVQLIASRHAPRTREGQL